MTDWEDVGYQHDERALEAAALRVWIALAVLAAFAVALIVGVVAKVVRP